MKYTRHYSYANFGTFILGQAVFTCHFVL